VAVNITYITINLLDLMIDICINIRPGRLVSESSQIQCQILFF